MNENKIIDMYENQNRSTYEIAKEFDTYPNKIRRILIKNGPIVTGKHLYPSCSLHTVLFYW